MNIVLVVTGAIGASLIPSWVLRMRREFKSELRCITTRSAEKYASADF
ncbi:flavoprotein [Actinomyces gaoshouyii]|nr:flavoprotein [Actinomyces gaoshouyii]